MSQACTATKWEEKQRDEDRTCWKTPHLMGLSVLPASEDGDAFLKTIHRTYTRPRRVSGYRRQQNQVIPLVGVKVFP